VDSEDKGFPDLPAQYGLHGVSQRVHGRRRRRGIGLPEGHQGHGELPVRFQVQKPRDLSIHEPRDHPHPDPMRGGHREEVTEHGPRVPIDVPVGPGPVLPGVALPHAGEDQYGLGPAHRLQISRGPGEEGPVVPRPEPEQAPVVGAEVVHARGKTRQVRAHRVDLDMVQGPGAGGGPEGHLPAWVTPGAEDPRAVVQEGCEGPEVKACLTLVSGRGHRRHRGKTARGEVLGEREGLRPPVNFHEARLVRPVQPSRSTPDTPVGVLGRFVVGQQFRGPVAHGTFFLHSA
jgi:hypothetical protein